MKNRETLTIIKPDAIANGHMGVILDQIIKNKFKILAMKYTMFTLDLAGIFYAVHRERPFYKSLLTFMTSGPVVAAILEKANAVENFRQLIGATDPSKAASGTIRQLFGQSIEANAIHGSDSDRNAQIEGNFFFSYFERPLILGQ